MYKDGIFPACLNLLFATNQFQTLIHFKEKKNHIFIHAYASLLRVNTVFLHTEVYARSSR